ncbi:antibiotic biosynthesis monooxygenase [Candidimonas humi]|jgi:quinol monooxygenase YgiN|uniref:Antibiotic biosynthesis monooxygenase family protein n=1 Tax=Candidimonas humi TaxID=683355 RepID=A0ABV8NYT9_9BURK|nr:antibiotic biosynthesis monooxygenase family protein [Candidimonas humi]MBV6306380.1 antibiotic biosynthesis monooxygenase [Candidimonas humi]
MADMFLTITRANIKAGSEKDARALLEKSLLPNDGSKPSDHVPGLIGFGLMRSKKDPSMFGLATVWKDEASFDALSKNPNAKTGGHWVEKFMKFTSGDVKGEGFYIESL